MMTSSFLPEPSAAKELFPNPTNVVADIPFPMDETNIASTSKVNNKQSARAETRRHSKEGSVSKSMKTDNLLMVILRGLPGSGKTSMATDLVARAPHGVVLSSDDYFVRDDKYEWRHEDLGRAHEFNQDRAQREVDKKTQLVVIDNTNVTAWEMRPYVEMATKAGYEVRLMEPNTPWSFDSRELARRNSHGVDLKTIRNMMDRYESGLEIEDLLERWDLAKFSSSQRGDGGCEDSRGFSFEPLMDIEEDHAHFGSAAQSRENSIREKNKHGKVSRWDQQAGNVDNLPRNIEPPNLNWSLIKESITALPGLTPNKNPFDGRNIPTFSVNKHISGVLPSSDALPFEGNGQNNDILPFPPNTPSFGGNNQNNNILPFNPNIPASLPSSCRTQLDNRHASGILPLNQSSRILPFGDNNQTCGILPSGDNNQPSSISLFGGINQVPAVNQVLSDRSQPPVINQATTPFGNNNPAPAINQTPGILPFDCNNQTPVPIPFGNQLPAISPFDDNNQAPLIAPFVHNQLPATSPFDSNNQAPPFVHNKMPATSPFDSNNQAPPNNKMPAISPFGDNRLSTIGFHSIKPTAAILAFVNNNPAPDLPPSCGNPSLFAIKTTTSETPPVGVGDKNTNKKKSRWKERAAAFLKTKELSKQSDVQSQLGTPKDDVNFQQELVTPKLNEAKMPSPAGLGQVANASNGVELLKSTSVEQIIPMLMSTDSNVIGKTFPPPKTIENDLPHPESSEKLPTLNSEEELPSTGHAVESNDDNSNDSLKSTDSPPENVDDATEGHDEADNIPGLTELYPKSAVRPFNIAKPFKLPSAFSFLQMDPSKQPNPTKETENTVVLPCTEESEAETAVNQTSNTTLSSSDEIPPLPPPSDLTDMPPLPFDPNDPNALPPPPPSPSAILLPPTPVSPSSIDLPSMAAPVAIPPPSPSTISLPDELSLIPQPPPPAEPCAVEDIPIPTCSGFNFSITGVQQSKMSRIGIKNPNSFGALMMARKRIKENKNIFNEEDDDISNADNSKNNDTNEIIEAQKQEATSFGKIDNKRITENTIKNNEHEKGEELKVIPKEPSSDPEHTETVESNIDDIFPLSKDGYVKAGRSKKEIKNNLASKQTSQDSKIAGTPDIECLTPVDPKLRCKLRASKVLTSLGNPTPELVNPVIDVKNDEPKKAPILYGGYVTKLASKDELKTFKTASSAKSTQSEAETKSNHKSMRRTSPRRSCSKSRSKSQKERRSRSRSRSHSPRNKKTSKLAKPESRSHNRTRSRSKSIVYSTEIKRSQRTRSRSRSIVYSEIKNIPKRSQSRSRVDSSHRKRISGPLSRSDSFERKKRSDRMRSRSRSTSIERRKCSKRMRSSSKQRKVISRSQSRSGSAERKMSKRTRSRSGSNSAANRKNEKPDTLNKKNKKSSRKSKSGERSSKSRKHKKLKSKKTKHKSKSKQRKRRKHSHGNEDADSDISEEKDIEVKSLEDDVESLENLVQILEQAQGVIENDEQSTLGKQNQLRRIRNLPLPKECAGSGSESEDSAKTPDMASEDSDETVCGKSSGEEETWEELKLKWEKKLKTKQKS